MSWHRNHSGETHLIPCPLPVIPQEYTSLGTGERGTLGSLVLQPEWMWEKKCWALTLVLLFMCPFLFFPPKNYSVSFQFSLQSLFYSWLHSGRVSTSQLGRITEWLVLEGTSGDHPVQPTRRDCFLQAGQVTSWMSALTLASVCMLHIYYLLFCILL